MIRYSFEENALTVSGEDFKRVVRACYRVDVGEAEQLGLDINDAVARERLAKDPTFVDEFTPEELAEMQKRFAA